MSQYTTAAELQTPDLHAGFLATETASALQRWDELLRLQVKFFSPTEIGFLSNFEPWHRAHTVLDVGCGNGAYLGTLRRQFPEKTYSGVDVSAGLVAIAHTSDPTIDVQVGDFFSFEPGRQFDIITMRFLLQHLTDFETVLAKCSELLLPRGQLLVIEPDLNNSRTSPPTPIFRGVVEAFESSRDAGGLMRRRLMHPEELIPRGGQWVLRSNEVLRAVHQGNDARIMSETLYQAWLDAFDESGLLRDNIAEARRELRGWSAHPDARSEIALRLIAFQRRLR